MKLILSSCDFGNVYSKNVIYDNLSKPIADCKVLFIPNEKATSELIETDLYPDRLCKFGFTKKNIVIFNHETPENFIGLDIDLIYVSGGNTFGTLDKIRKTGFDNHIINYVKSGVVYVGGSAGAHIATQNIEHVAKYDENNVELTDFNGLGLFKGILMCHYSLDRREDLNELEKQSKYEIQYLTDSDSIVVTDSESVIVTEYGRFVVE